MHKNRSKAICVFVHIDLFSALFRHSTIEYFATKALPEFVIFEEPGVPGYTYLRQYPNDRIEEVNFL